MRLSHTRFLLAGLALVSSLSAQLNLNLNNLNNNLVKTGGLEVTTQTKKASYANTFGISEANVFVDLESSGTRNTSPSSVSAHTHARGGFKLMGFTGTALSFEADATAGLAATTSKMKVVLANKTVYNKTWSITSVSDSVEFGAVDLFPAPPELTVVFPVGSVGLSLNVGGGMGFTMGVALSTKPSAVLGGALNQFGKGSVKVKYTIAGFGVGVSADLRFLDTTVGGQVIVTATAIPTGTLEIKVKPLAIVLKAFLTAPIIGAFATQNLWSYTMPEVVRIFGL